MRHDCCRLAVEHFPLTMSKMIISFLIVVELFWRVPLVCSMLLWELFESFILPVMIIIPLYSAQLDLDTWSRDCLLSFYYIKISQAFLAFLI